MSLKVAGGPVTCTVVVEPVNTSAAMSRTAFTDSAAVGSPRVPATPTGRYQALRSTLTAWASVIGSDSRSCTSRTWSPSVCNRRTSSP